MQTKHKEIKIKHFGKQPCSVNHDMGVITNKFIKKIQASVDLPFFI